MIVNAGYRGKVGAAGAVASLTATSGVTYTAGLAGVSAEEVSVYAAAISNNAEITNATTVVYIDFGKIHRKVSVADQVTLSLNGVDYAFDVIGFNHDELTTPTAYGAVTATGKAGITFQMHNLFATTYRMNSGNTNIGGWKNSEMRTVTMATMKGYMPVAWQTAIKPVTKVSGTGGLVNTLEAVSDNCFLLSEIEIFGRTIHSISGEGTQYAYYKGGATKIKRRETAGSAGRAWWERSPYLSESAYWFGTVSSDGNAVSGNPTINQGVAFGVCV